MEHWQNNQIRDNLPDLIRFTVCSASFLAALESKGVLSEEDVEIIKCEKVKHEKASLLYRLLVSRSNSYDVLLQALLDTKQSGAADVLTRISTEKLGTLQVNFQTKPEKLNDLLNAKQIKELQDWTQKHLGHKERMKLHHGNLQVIRNTIPEPDPLYVPRFLCRRHTVNPELFGKDCSDVFIFKGVERNEIRKFNSFHEISTSTEELMKKKSRCRLILLRLDAHWERICTRLSTPAHLIRYEAETQEFVLDTTTGISDILYQHLKQSTNVNCIDISEEDFIENNLPGEGKTVCICDSPGMGKSFLLANIARKLSVKFPDKIVVFLQLKDVITEQQNQCDALAVILQHLSTSPLSHYILHELILTQKVNLELLLDGLDEVQQEHLSVAKKFLNSINEDMPNAQVYVTSRTVVRKELELITKAISYDIQPFDEVTQAEYLTSVKMKKFPNADPYTLEDYSIICLEKLRNSLTEEDNKIAGIPLLCKMIAEVFSDEASAFSENGHQCRDNYLESVRMSVQDIYKLYIQRQLGVTQCNFKCMNLDEPSLIQCNITCQVKSYHVLHALKLIYPNIDVGNIKHRQFFEDLHAHEILRPEVLRQVVHVQFVHRTFAEYLVAEYVTSVILGRDWCWDSPDGHGFCLEKLVLESFIQCREYAVLYFVDAFLEQKPLSTEFVSKEIEVLSDDELSIAIYSCVNFDYERVLGVILKIHKASSNCPVDKKPNTDAAFNILKTAASRCSAATIRLLDQFYLEYYNFELINELPNLDADYIGVAKIAIRRVEYEIALLFVDKVNLTGHKILIEFLENTYSENNEYIDKKIDIAQLLVRKNASLLTEKYEGNTALCGSKVHPKAIQFLIASGADIREVGFDGKTFLHNVAEYLYEAEIRNLCRRIFVGRAAEELLFLLARPGVRFQFPFSRARAIINLAALEVSITTKDQFQLFWHAGASITNKSQNLSKFPTSDALSRSHLGLEQLLFVAVEDNDILVVDWLLNQDISLLEKHYDTEKERTPIFLAVESKQMKMFDYLVYRSANIFAVDKHGWTILHVAVFNKDHEIFRQVVEILGSQPEDRGRIHASALEAEVSNKNAPSNIQELFNWKNNSLCTPLHVVCAYMDLPRETLDFFLTCGSTHVSGNAEAFRVDINAADEDGETPMILAIRFKRSLEFVKHLIFRGASCSAKDQQGRNLAQICAVSDQMGHLKYFVELGCDVNETDNEGNNALQNAADTFLPVVSLECIQYLVSVGADKWNRNKWGQTAYDIAIEQELNAVSQEVLDLLEPT